MLIGAIKAGRKITHLPPPAPPPGSSDWASVLAGEGGLGRQQGGSLECRAPSSQDGGALTQAWALPQGQKNLAGPRTQAARHLTFFLVTAPGHSCPKSSSRSVLVTEESQQNGGRAAACWLCGAVHAGGSGQHVWICGLECRPQTAWPTPLPCPPYTRVGWWGSTVALHAFGGGDMQMKRDAGMKLDRLVG